MTVLTIKLTSPLQSYGNEASFNRRPTNSYPTKSAIIGIISAALGYRRDDNRIASLNQLEFAVRVDQVGSTMTDFHIVEYDLDKHTKKLTYRDYLQDFIYVVGIGSDNDDEIEKIIYALRHPRFQLSLGRRANPPAGVLKIDKFESDSPVEVLSKKVPWQASKWYQRKYGKEIFEADLFADANLLPNEPNLMVKDLVGSFDQRNRYYSYRGVAKTRIKLANDQTKHSETTHDVMSFI